MLSKIKLKSVLIPFMVYSFSLFKFIIFYHLFNADDPENLLFFSYSPLFFVIFPLFYGIYGAIGLGLESGLMGLLIQHFQPGIIDISTILLIPVMYTLVGICVYKFWYKHNVVNLSDDKVTPPYLFNTENTCKIFVTIGLTYFIAQIFVHFSLLNLDHISITESIEFYHNYFFTLLIFSFISNILSVSVITLTDTKVQFPEMNSPFQLSEHIKEVNVLIFIFLTTLLIQGIKILFSNQFNEIDFYLMFFNALILVILIIIKPKTKELIAFPYKTSLKEILVFISLITTLFLALLIIIFLSYWIYGKFDLNKILTGSFNIIIIFFTYILAICIIKYFDDNFTKPLQIISQISHTFIHNKLKDNSSSINDDNDKILNMDTETIKNKLDELSLNEKFEIGDLALNIKDLIDDLEYYINNLELINREEERKKYGIAISKGIQRSMFPKLDEVQDRWDDFGIYSLFRSKEDVGGDFYGYQLVDDDHLIIFIGDASGHGISAALFMIKIKTMIQDYFDLKIKFEKILHYINNQISKSNVNNMFASVFLGILTISTGQFRYVNAGHEPPVLCKKNSKCELLKIDSGIVLGLKKGFKYPIYETYLNEGDRFYLYTDGITELRNIDGEEYSLERLMDFLDKNNSLNIEDLSLKFKEVNDNFGNHVDFDDKTFLVLEYRHNPKNDKSGK
ncbi:MAG: serine/threonine-protein phosphatase [Methanobrevibacter sp.]|jgi:sigma-B regulation protein RsbU (phosphoserine phosphatase)|nr:serine/threonine-protein phosphatase [Methanobrevibacter sp.]